MLQGHLHYSVAVAISQFGISQLLSPLMTGIFVSMYFAIELLYYSAISYDMFVLIQVNYF